MLTPLERPLTIGDVRVTFTYDALAGGLNYLDFLLKVYTMFSICPPPLCGWGHVAPPRGGSDSSSGTPSSSSPSSSRAALCASADPSPASRSASFAESASCSYRSSALGVPGEVPDVLLVRGVGGGHCVVDRVRKGGGEGGLAAVGDGHEGPVLVAHHKSAGCVISRIWGVMTHECDVMQPLM